MDYIYHCSSPLGGITLSSDGAALTGLWFDGQKHFGTGLSDAPQEVLLPVFSETEKWLALYFSGAIPDFTPALTLRGSPFQKAVWELLLTIPYGQTATYGQIARLLAKKQGLARVSAQAVGGAVGRNPISLIIPCHRVVGANGSLTGYAGGLERKAWLISIEYNKHPDD